MTQENNSDRGEDLRNNQVISHTAFLPRDAL